MDVPADVLLAPGAGSDRNQGSLVLIDDALPGRVRRMNFGYRTAGRKFPDREPLLLQDIVDEVTLLHPSPVLGGRSMGGRMCSIAAARKLVNARALVLICYPLHPPGKPDRLRTDHFPAITVPCLFLSGTKDAFGTPEQLADATAAIPGHVEHVWIEGADHGLRRQDAHIAQVVKDWIEGLRS
jgi:uncharacterized protein